MNSFITCSTAALAMALAAASFAHAQTPQKSVVAGQANAVSNPTFSKQRVDGGDLQPDTVFQENYQRQPVPASK
jgi:hypothetical protein